MVDPEPRGFVPSEIEFGWKEQIVIANGSCWTVSSDSVQTAAKGRRLACGVWFRLNLR
jgi:hypothetical protein